MSKLSNIYNLSLLWIVFTATVPFVFYLAIPNLPGKLIVAVGIALMSCGFIIREKITTGDPIIVTILMIQIIYSFIATFLHELFFLGLETLYINMAIQHIAVMIVYLYIKSFYSVLKVGKSTVYIMAIMGILGVLAFFLGVAGLLSVKSYWVREDDSVGFNFMLTFSNTVDFLGDALIIRIAGFFDEPGTFAFYITFALLTNKLYKYSKKLEILLILTGLFTLSLAFYITLVFYFVLFYRSIRHFKKILLAILSILAVAYYIDASQNESEINSIIYIRTIGRLQLESSGSGKVITGDNRSYLIINTLDAFIKSPIIGHGFSSQNNPRSEFYNIALGANLLTPLALHGLLGTIFLFMHYFYFSFIVLIRQKRIERNSFAAWVIVTINLFQRPNVFGGLYAYFVIIILIEATKDWIATHRNLSMVEKCSTQPLGGYSLKGANGIFLSFS